MALEEIGKSPNPAAHVPPPPAEVKVRTFRSDLDALAKSGGALPHFRTVAVEGLSLSKMGSPERHANPSVKTDSRAIWGIIALALAVLGVILWFGYNAFLRSR